MSEGSHRYLIWIELEEVDEEGDNVDDHSILINGGAVFETEDMNEAIVFGDRLQALGEIMGGEPYVRKVDVTPQP